MIAVEGATCEEIAAIAVALSQITQVPEERAPIVSRWKLAARSFDEDASNSW
ncbi:MAG: hypothetical protein ABI282_11725 [Candidatus Baltobacteraceae bacterium]